MINTVMLSAMAFVQNTIGYAINKLKEERGQDILEYAVLVGAIALVAGGVLFVFLDDGIWDRFTEKISDCLAFNTEGNCNLD